MTRRQIFGDELAGEAGGAIDHDVELRRSHVRIPCGESCADAPDDYPHTVAVSKSTNEYSTSEPVRHVAQALPSSFRGARAREPGMTNVTAHSRGANAPEFCWKSCPLENARAQGMPGARRTGGLVRNGESGCAHEHTGSAEASGIPCVMALRLMP